MTRHETACCSHAWTAWWRKAVSCSESAFFLGHPVDQMQASKTKELARLTYYSALQADLDTAELVCLCNYAKHAAGTTFPYQNTNCIHVMAINLVIQPNCKSYATDLVHSHSCSLSFCGLTVNVYKIKGLFGLSVYGKCNQLGEIHIFILRLQ